MVLIFLHRRRRTGNEPTTAVATAQSGQGPTIERISELPDVAERSVTSTSPSGAMAMPLGVSIVAETAGPLSPVLEFVPVSATWE